MKKKKRIKEKIPATHNKNTIPNTPYLIYFILRAPRQALPPSCRAPDDLLTQSAGRATRVPGSGSSQLIS